MNFPIAIMIVWLNASGGIEARASGVAVDVVSCQKLAEKNIADEIAHDPDVKGLTPKFACWDTTAAPKAPVAPVAPPKQKTDEV